MYCTPFNLISLTLAVYISRVCSIHAGMHDVILYLYTAWDNAVNNRYLQYLHFYYTGAYYNRNRVQYNGRPSATFRSFHCDDRPNTHWFGHLVRAIHLSTLISEFSSINAISKALRLFKCMNKGFVTKKLCLHLGPHLNVRDHVIQYS